MTDGHHDTSPPLEGAAQAWALPVEGGRETIELLHPNVEGR